MKITEERLRRIIKEELSAVLHEKEPLDEIGWPNIGLGFSKEEKFKKLRKRIEQEMEAGSWIAKPSLPKNKAGLYVAAADVGRFWRSDLAGAIAKKELEMELDDDEQKAYAYFFEGGKDAEETPEEMTARMDKERQQKRRGAEREHEKGVASRRERKEIFGKIKKYLGNSRDLRGMSDQELQNNTGALAIYLRDAERIKDSLLAKAKRLADLDKDEKSMISDVEYVLERDIRKLKELTRGHGKPDFPKIIGRNRLRQFQSNDYSITNLGSGRYQVDLRPGMTGRAMYRKD